MAIKTSARLSACSHVFGERTPLGSLCRLLQRANIQELELLGEPQTFNLRSALRTLRSAGVSVSALTAASRLSTGRDPASNDAAQRRATVDHYRRCVDAAERLGCSLVGMAPCAVGRYWTIAPARDELAWSQDCVRDVALYAAPAGINIGIEVLCRYASRHVNTARDGILFARQVKSDNVGLVLDLFHMNIEERSLSGAISAARGWLRNVHIADSNRLGIGHGHLDLDAIVEALHQVRYQGPLTFEAFPTRTTGKTAYSTTDRRRLRQFLLEFRPRLRAAGWN